MLRRILATISLFLFTTACEIPYEDLRVICEEDYQECTEPLRHGANQWDYIETSLYCHLERRQCINRDFGPVYLSCDEIWQVCKEDAQYNSGSWFTARIKYLECERGFEDCEYGY